MQYVEYVCLGLCAFHCLIDFVVAFFNGRKIKKLCDKCHGPIFEGIEHDCVLDDKQLGALVEFIRSIKRECD